VDLGFEPSRIAVIQTELLGDVIFASPLVNALKSAWPGARVAFVCPSQAIELARCIPGVAEAVGCDPLGEGRRGSGLWGAARALRGVELAVVPQGTLRSALLAYWSRARVRVGPALPLVRALYTVPVPRRDREPLVERTLDLARALGVEAPPDLRLEVPPGALEEAAGLLGTAPSVGLVVGCERETKRWPVESFAALADRLSEAGWRPVLLGSSRDRELAEAVKSRLARAEVLDLVGRPIIESAAAIARLRAVVGGDTGLLHVSRAVGTPALLLFGPTDPGAHTLEPHAQALRLGLPCQPCHGEGQRACPLKHHDCMKKLGVERVLSALRPLLPRSP
jgi:heptosyltransferase-2